MLSSVKGKGKSLTVQRLLASKTVSEFNTGWYRKLCVRGMSEYLGLSLSRAWRQAGHNTAWRLWVCRALQTEKLQGADSGKPLKVRLQFWPHASQNSEIFSISYTVWTRFVQAAAFCLHPRTVVFESRSEHRPFFLCFFVVLLCSSMNMPWCYLIFTTTSFYIFPVHY
jgi:hypothetical protein